MAAREIFRRVGGGVFPKRKSEKKKHVRWPVRRRRNMFDPENRNQATSSRGEKVRKKKKGKNHPRRRSVSVISAGFHEETAQGVT